MLPFKITCVCFSVANNSFAQGHKWQNALLALLLPAKVKQLALTGSFGPDSESSLFLHIIGEPHHAHTALKHVTQSVIFRVSSDHTGKQEECQEGKFHAQGFSYTLGKSSWDFPPSLLPKWVPLAPAGSPYRASSLMRQYLSVQTSTILCSGIQLATLSLATEINMDDFPL